MNRSEKAAQVIKSYQKKVKYRPIPDAMFDGYIGSRYGHDVKAEIASAEDAKYLYNLSNEFLKDMGLAGVGANSALNIWHNEVMREEFFLDKRREYKMENKKSNYAGINVSEKNVYDCGVEGMKGVNLFVAPEGVESQGDVMKVSMLMDEKFLHQQKDGHYIMNVRDDFNYQLTEKMIDEDNKEFLSDNKIEATGSELSEMVAKAKDIYAKAKGKSKDDGAQKKEPTAKLEKPIYLNRVQEKMIRDAKYGKSILLEIAGKGFGNIYVADKDVVPSKNKDKEKLKGKFDVRLTNVEYKFYPSQKGDKVPEPPVEIMKAEDIKEGFDAQRKAYFDSKNQTAEAPTNSDDMQMDEPELEMEMPEPTKTL